MNFIIFVATILVIAFLNGNLSEKNISDYVNETENQ